MYFCLKDRVWKIRDIERKVWTDELADMHRIVNEELRAIRQMAAGLIPTSDPTSDPPSFLCNGPNSQHLTGNADSDDDGFDIDSVTLKIVGDDDQPVPEMYFARSPAVDGGQSLSW